MNQATAWSKESLSFLGLVKISALCILDSIPCLIISALSAAFIDCQSGMFKSIILQSVSKWLFRKKFPVTQRQKLCREHREETRQLNFTQTFAYGKVMELTQRELVLAFLVKGANFNSLLSHHQKLGGILYKAKLMGVVPLTFTVLSRHFRARGFSAHIVPLVYVSFIHLTYSCLNLTSSIKPSILFH